MLRYIRGAELKRFPTLRNSMFRDRADQFKTRLGWDVTIDEFGYERDEYDALDPLYVIWEQPDGRHGGSMRLLPTTGPTMVNDHFGHLTSGKLVHDPQIWECTRFCLARDTAPRTAGALMLGGGEVMRHYGVKHYIGVFDARMERIYRAIGSEPQVIGQTGEGREKISVGLWQFSEASREIVARRAGVSLEQSQAWFEASVPMPARDIAATG